MGKGAVYLMIANGAMFLVGYIIHFVLGRYLGPVSYGIFGVILTLMSIVDIVFATGFPQSASKYIAEDNSKIGSIIRDSNHIQIVLCIVTSVIYLSLSRVIADLLNDSSLTPYIMLSTLIIPAYAFYSIYRGYLNGLKQFGKQAKAALVGSAVKIIAVFVLVFLGFGVTGAIAGYIIAALVGFGLSWLFLRRVEKTKEPFGWRKLIGFGIPATLFAIFLYLLANLDLFFIKAIGENEEVVGYYMSASTISKAPFYLFAGLAGALLPSISKSTSMNNTSLTKSYIRQSMRYMLIMLIPGILLINATSGNLISLVYSSQYIDAAGSLRILIFGLGSLTVFTVLANVIIGAGKPKLALGIIVPLIIIDVILNVVLIPRYGLNGAAWATTSASIAGLLAAATYVCWKFKALVNAMSALKIVLASVAVYFIAANVSVSPGWLIPLYVGLAALYGGLLWAMREIKREDIDLVKRILLKSPSPQ